MPLKVNVGLSRKVADANYGSRGASVNVELELDSSLIGEPTRFQEKIRQVYALARTSLNEELTNNGHQPTPTANGSKNGSANGQRPRPATASQVKAIKSIADNQGLDLARYLAEHYKVNRPEDLDIKTASKVIDALKAAAQPRGTG